MRLYEIIQFCSSFNETVVFVKFMPDVILPPSVTLSEAEGSHKLFTDEILRPDFHRDSE